jgi:hypothetical protein
MQRAGAPDLSRAQTYEILIPASFSRTQRSSRYLSRRFSTSKIEVKEKKEKAQMFGPIFDFPFSVISDRSGW